MATTPLVSVLIPCFNAEAWIAEAVESCLSQDYPNVEVVVVDDGSTDGSAKVLQAFGDRIVLVLGENRGAPAARNEALRRSRGEYIQYLDSDDLLLPGKLSAHVARLSAGDVDAVYGDWRYQTHRSDGSIEVGEPIVTPPPNSFLEGLLSDRFWVAPSAYLFKRAVIEAGPGWDETLRAGQDRDFVLQLALRGLRFEHVPGCRSVYRQHDKPQITRQLSRWMEGHYRLAVRARRQLESEDRLDGPLRSALIFSHGTKLLRLSSVIPVGLSYRILYELRYLNGELDVEGRPWPYRAAYRLFGYFIAEGLWITFGKVARWRPAFARS